MGGKKAKDPRKVRTRRVCIYTFLMILALFYASAHMTLESGRRAAGAAGTGEAAGAAGTGGGAAGTGETMAGETKPAGEGNEVPGGGNGEADSGSGLVLGEGDFWCLILTNAEYPVPEDYQTDLVLKAVPGGQSVDERIYEPLTAMLNDMTAQGLSPVVCSGYRTLDKQEKLFNRKVKSYVKSGHSKQEAYDLARRTISIPGSGEHCLGLAVDIYSKSYRKLEQGFENTPEGMWLREHAQDYGFTLRYDKGKEEITGIDYEPWHFRYVGVKAAKYLKEHQLSLEEFYIKESLYG